MSDQLNEINEIPEEKKQFCTFHLGNRFFGIEILDVKEIIEEIKITTIYHAPDEILGFINVRGQVHLIIDLRVLLNFDKKEINTDNRIILFNSHVGESFGVLIDRIGHMVEVYEHQIEYRIHDDKSIHIKSNDSLSKFAIGACKLQQLMILLDAKKFLKNIKKQ